MSLAGIYRTLHITTKEYTFFSAVHETFFKIDHILGHKAHLKRQSKSEITPFTLSANHGLKLYNSSNRKGKKYIDSQKLTNSLLNENCIKIEINKEIKNFLKLNEYENTVYSNLQDKMKTVSRVHSSKCLHLKKSEKSHINNLAIYLQSLGNNI